jgi:hypothetical protein
MPHRERLGSTEALGIPFVSKPFAKCSLETGDKNKTIYQIIV